MAQDIEFLGGYSLEHKTIVIVKIDSKSYWLAVGESRKGYKVVDVAPDLSHVEIESKSGITRLEIESPTLLADPARSVEEPEVSVNLVDSSIELTSEMEQALLESAMGLKAAGNAPSKRYQEIVAGGLTLSMEERAQIEAIEAEKGNTVFWETGEDGEVLSIEVHSWPQKFVEDEATGAYRLEAVDEEFAAQHFQRLRDASAESEDQP